MSVESVKPRINPNYNAAKNVNNLRTGIQSAQVSFKGLPQKFKSPNVIVGLMDFIAAGGFAASFLIQDGLGFIAPRVGKGLFRGGKEKKDENGNVILDKNGNPKHELNWAYARKEGVREIITGPSAFIIPWLALKGINKKFGTANSVKINYIDGFQNAFTKYIKENPEVLTSQTPDKTKFYNEVFKSILENTINSHPNAEKLTAREIELYSKLMTKTQLKTESILAADKSLLGKVRGAELAKFRSVEDIFMHIKKSRIGGKVNEMAANIVSSDGKKVVAGGIGEISTALTNYFDDAFKYVKNTLNKNANTNITELIKQFTNHKMGSRILTNLGLFLTVATFYTQIPKLYNMGLKGNPALGEDNSEPALQKNNKSNKKDVNFTGNPASLLGEAGSRVFNNKAAKWISDIYELEGPIIQGGAMTSLLYGFCIPARLINAQDKYDYKEIYVRDFTAFTALLFGAKALARLFSDGFTKLTGLALNSKNMNGRNIFQKAIDYLNPLDGNHSVLSSKQLNSKYTNIHQYKDGVNGFMEFIEQSGGNLKKAFSRDKNVKSVIEKILGKAYDSASSAEIKTALSNAHKNKTTEIKEFYKLFTKENGLLNKAKTCNSTFGFLSTLVLVPGLIIALTDICKHMTEKGKAKDDAAKLANQNLVLQASLVPSSRPTMAGFLNK